MSQKILIADKIDPICAELLRKDFEVEEKVGLTEDELAGIVGEYDALLVRSKTKVTAKIIAAENKEMRGKSEKSGGKLRAIGRAGIGVDNIDLAAATSAGIPVFNAPGASVQAVAEHAIGLLFALTKHVVRATAGIREGVWEKDALKPRELSGKMLGIIGFGKIGRKTGEIGRALGMNVLAYDPFVIAAAEEGGVSRLSLDELVAQADAVSIHLPLTPDTKKLLNGEKFALMKPSAYLVNTSRGEVIDLDALLFALENGKLAGAGLDVFPIEPPDKETTERMAKIPNLIATPHIAGSAVEAQGRIAEEIAETLANFLLKSEAKNVVNREVLQDK